MTELRIESGNGDGDNEGAAPASEEYKDHDAGEAGGDDGFTDDALTALRTKTDWSDRGRIFNSGGRVCATRGRRVRTPFTTSRVEALPALRMLTRTPRLPSWRAMLVWGAKPSRDVGDIAEVMVELPTTLIGCRLVRERCASWS